MVNCEGCKLRMEKAVMNSDGSWTADAVCEESNCFGTGRSVGKKKLSGKGIQSSMLSDGRGAGSAAMGEMMLTVDAGQELCNTLRRKPKTS